MSTEVDTLLDAFFASPNTVWPDRDATHGAAGYLAPFLAAAQDSAEVPLILPRNDGGPGPAVTYVICRSRAHAGRIRAMLTSWVGTNWASFDGRTAKLKPADPIESAVIAFAGQGSTFILCPATRDAHLGMFAALKRMISTIQVRPSRGVALPRPIGRLIRDFETSLAAGQSGTSLELLDEIERTGGASHENIAFLRIRRLGQLGADGELLQNPALPALVAAEPPRLVREEILGAWFRAVGTRGSIEDLQALLRASDIDVALLVDASLRPRDPDAWAVSGAVALERGDVELAADLVSLAPVSADPDLLAALEEMRGTSPGVAAPVPAPEPASPSEPVAPETPETPDSWLSWVAAISRGEDVEFDEDLVSLWEPPGAVDADIAAAVRQLDDSKAEPLFAGLAAFIDADDVARPAWQTAAEFIVRHLLADSLTPSDLGAISALLAIFLRGGPGADRYREMLHDLEEYRDRWASIATAPAAIDIVDLVVCAPTAAPEARQNFIALGAEQLHRLRHRLSPSLRTVADLATADAALGWVWSVEDEPAGDVDQGTQVLPARILLYSLEAAVLARAKDAVERLYPGIEVETSDAKVGNEALRAHARNADLAVLATRRATHSATLYIQANRGPQTRVLYADGCGSGSMMRAIEQGIAEFSS